MSRCKALISLGYTADDNGMGSESVDHVFPVFRGGGHTWANVQLAHLFCNMKKGAKV